MAPDAQPGRFVTFVIGAMIASVGGVMSCILGELGMLMEGAAPFLALEWWRQVIVGMAGDLGFAILMWLFLATMLLGFAIMTNAVVRRRWPKTVPAPEKCHDRDD
jgi:hypothetical protein